MKHREENGQGIVFSSNPKVTPLGKGKIDARTSAFLALYAVTRSKEYLKSALTSALKVATGAIEPQYLILSGRYYQTDSGGGNDYLVRHLSRAEAVFYGMSLFALLVSVVTGYYLEGLGKTIAISFIGAEQFPFWTTVALWLGGKMTFLSAVAGLVGAFVGTAGIFVGAIRAWINGQPWWKKGFWFGVLITNGFALIAGNAEVISAKMAAVLHAITSGAAGLMGLWGDFTDWNTIVG